MSDDMGISLLTVMRFNIPLVSIIHTYYDIIGTEPFIRKTEIWKITKYASFENIYVVESTGILRRILNRLVNVRQTALQV